MKIFTNINENIPKNSFVTIGFFDGVHLGHRYIINEMKNRASSSGKEELLITLWPHPSFYFGNPVRLLNTLNEKIKILTGIGLKNLLILKFDTELAAMSGNEFINSILLDKLNTSEIIMGYNNSFGSKDEGRNEISKDIINIVRLNKFNIPDVAKISSSNIRKFLEKGMVDKASGLLGYNYYLTGCIERGYQIGRKIGFPTANLSGISKLKLIPANGVYIIEAFVNGNWLPAMLNIGTRPSFDGKDRTIEFHILDFNGDLYDSEITVRFIKRIRNEIRFNSSDKLIDQLIKDRQATSSYFSGV